MKQQLKNIAVLLVLGGMLTGFGLWAALRTPDTASSAERRPLAQPPELSASAILSGDYAKKAESAAPDQFPLRETFRRIRALVARDVLGQKDVNGLYTVGGYAAKIEYPQQDSSLDHAAERFQWIVDNLVTPGGGSRVFLSVIPDKGAFLAEENGYPALDYDAFIDSLRKQLPGMDYIDLRDTLSLDSYYRTDLHWRQETLAETARALAAGMGVTLPESAYTSHTLDTPFSGIYAGQTALPLEPDALTWLTSGTLDACQMWNGETGTYGPVYDLDKAGGRDPYELFLSGSLSLLRLENPGNPDGRELIIFRDSFASSLTPLMIEGYSSITLVDIRYLPSARLGSVLDFHGQDVLFLYSVPVLNNSDTLK